MVGNLLQISRQVAGLAPHVPGSLSLGLFLTHVWGRSHTSSSACCAGPLLAQPPLSVALLLAGGAPGVRVLVLLDGHLLLHSLLDDTR